MGSRGIKDVPASASDAPPAPCRAQESVWVPNVELPRYMYCHICRVRLLGLARPVPFPVGLGAGFLWPGAVPFGLAVCFAAGFLCFRFSFGFLPVLMCACMHSHLDAVAAKVSTQWLTPRSVSVTRGKQPGGPGGTGGYII